MAKKKGIINNEDKAIELNNSSKVLDKMKSLEKQKTETLTRLNISKGYILTTDIDKWNHKVII